MTVTDTRPSLRSWLPWLLLAVAVVAMLAIASARTAPNDSPDARADRIAHRLRCPTCQSESVAESESATSSAIRADIIRRIADDQTDDDIERAYAERYGEWILLTPSNGGLGFLVWGIPVLAVLLGAAVIVAFLRRADAGSAEASEVDTSRGRRRAITWGVGITAGAVVAAFVLTGALGDRRPGGTATGNSGVAATVDPLDSLRAAARARPRDYAARIAYARALVASDLAEAVKQYDAAAAIDPSQPEPLAYTGWLEAQVATRVDDTAQRTQLIDAALARLDQARELDPEYPDAQVFTGVVLLNFRNDAAGAVPHLQRYLQLAPDGPQADLVRSTLARAVREAGSAK